MTAIELFKKCMNHYWSELVHEDWIVDVVTLSRPYIVHDNLNRMMRKIEHIHFHIAC
jgi:hypothetical protein